VFEGFLAQERGRVRFEGLGILDSDEAFYRVFHKAALNSEGGLLGDTIIVLNTVMNAINMVMWFRAAHPDWKIYQMSTCLTPADRELILAEIHQALRGSQPILLIATSVVECGVDFSFYQGFRERGSMLSAIQLSGRVNRSKEYSEGVLYEFSFKINFIQKSTFTSNPSIYHSIEARQGIQVNPDNCTTVVEQEIALSSNPSLVTLESSCSFKDMSEQFQVIPDNTVSVLVDKDIINRVRNLEFVTPVDINRNSVSIYRSKLDPTKDNNFCQFVTSNDDMYFWTGSYDPKIYGIYANLVEDAVL